MIKQIDFSDAAKKMAEIGFNPATPGSDLPWNTGALIYDFENETSGASLFGIARFVRSLIANDTKSVILLSELRVWPSEHDILLIDSVLTSYAGLKYLPPDGTFLYCNGGDGEKVATICHLVILFGWEISIWLSCPKTQVDISHDGRISVFLSEGVEESCRTFVDISGGRIPKVIVER